MLTMNKGGLTAAARKNPTAPSKADNNVLKVYCKVCSASNEDTCVEIGSCTVVLTHPENCVGNRNGFSKRTVCTFDQVFGEQLTNKDLFDQVVLPLVKDLIAGSNSVLFAYGTSGREKMHIMKGLPNDSGIVPRCFDVIFNSISNQQAKKFVFKPDHLNGFEVQTEAEADKDRKKELDLLMKMLQNGDRANDNEAEEPKINADSTRMQGINKNKMCAIFVSLIQIYNNSVYDVLDADSEEKHRRTQIKILRQDGQQNMYVHGVKEVEVKSSAEAFELFLKAQDRKIISAMNLESKYCHSVFTVRLVQTLAVDDIASQQKNMSISQLSFVDVAGPERIGKGNTTSNQIKQTGKINNSLLSFRKCLEVLRENQIQGTSKMVPYRNCKLTHLFKNYFDGDGYIRLLTCISPLTSDFEDTLQALSFAKSTKEMYMTVPSITRIDNINRNEDPISTDSTDEKEDQSSTDSKDASTGQSFSENKDLNEDQKSSEELKSADTETASLKSARLGTPHFAEIPSSFPCLELQRSTDELTELVTFLQQRSERATIEKSYFSFRHKEFREEIEKLEQQNTLIRQKRNSIMAEHEAEKERSKRLTERLLEKESTRTNQQKLLKEKEEEIREAKKQVKQMELQAKEVAAEKERIGINLKRRLQVTKQKAEMELNRKLHQLRVEHEEKQRTVKKKIQRLGKILASDFATPSSYSDTPQDYPKVPGLPISSSVTTSEESIPQLQKNLEVAQNVLDQPLETAKTNKQTSVQDLITVFQQDTPKAENSHQHRRSQSAKEGVWLTHRSGMVPKTPGTVLQPLLKCSKSIDKLPAAEEVARHKISKYCLLTQEPDQSGELETRVYKADVVPTIGGGAQFVFNEMETLQQKSPCASPLPGTFAASPLPCSPKVDEEVQTNAVA